MAEISTVLVAVSFSIYSQSDQNIPSAFSKPQIPEQIVPDFFLCLSASRLSRMK